MRRRQKTPRRGGERRSKANAVALGRKLSSIPFLFGPVVTLASLPGQLLTFTTSADRHRLRIDGLLTKGLGNGHPLTQSRQAVDYVLKEMDRQEMLPQPVSRE